MPPSTHCTPTRHVLGERECPRRVDHTAHHVCVRDGSGNGRQILEQRGARTGPRASLVHARHDAMPRREQASAERAAHLACVQECHRLHQCAARA